MTHALGKLVRLFLSLLEDGRKHTFSKTGPKRPSAKVPTTEAKAPYAIMVAMVVVVSWIGFGLQMQEKWIRSVCVRSNLRSARSEKKIRHPQARTRALGFHFDDVHESRIEPCGTPLLAHAETRLDYTIPPSSLTSHSYTLLRIRMCISPYACMHP